MVISSCSSSPLWIHRIQEWAPYLEPAHHKLPCSTAHTNTHTHYWGRGLLPNSSDIHGSAKTKSLFLNTMQNMYFNGTLPVPEPWTCALGSRRRAASPVLIFHVNPNNQPRTKKANIVFYIRAMSQHTALDALLPASIFVCLCFQLEPPGTRYRELDFSRYVKTNYGLGLFAPLPDFNSWGKKTNWGLATRQLFNTEQHHTVELDKALLSTHG